MEEVHRETFATPYSDSSAVGDHNLRIREFERNIVDALTTVTERYNTTNVTDTPGPGIPGRAVIADSQGQVQ
jgi:hypothetical protein